MGRGVPWAPALLAAIHSAGITQGPIQSRSWELWREDIADFSGTLWVSLVAFEEQQSKRLIITEKRGFYDLELKLGGKSYLLFP